MWTVAVLPMLVAPAAGGPFAFPSMLFFGEIRPAAHGPEALLRAGERSVAAPERAVCYSPSLYSTHITHP